MVLNRICEATSTDNSQDTPPPVVITSKQPRASTKKLRRQWPDATHLHITKDLTTLREEFFWAHCEAARTTLAMQNNGPVIDRAGVEDSKNSYIDLMNTTDNCHYIDFISNKPTDACTLGK